MRTTLLILLITLSSKAYCQAGPPTVSSGQLNTDKYIETVSKKAEKVQDQLSKKSEQALSSLKKQEEKIIRKLSKIDSSKAKEYAIAAKAKWESLEARLKNPGKLSSYIPGLDSLSTTLNFLNGESSVLQQAAVVKDKLKDAIGKVDELKESLAKAEDIKKFLKERKEQIREQLEKLGFVKELKQLNKQVYYYAQQIKEYKEILNDPKKIEQKALELLSKTKIWKEFFRKNSMLARLFRLPDPNNPVSMTSIAGLQTRAQVGALIQQQIASAGPGGAQAFQQQMQSAQGQLRSIQNNIINRAGGGSASSSDIMPEGFKPNTEKTKSFLKRLELGTNLQTQKGNNYFPNSSDIALSLGYKLNDKSIIGIGASYKLGLGRGWNAIKISSEGMGLRSFVDWKIKGGFWITGGYEMNYRQAFNRVDQLRGLDSWQHSGLLGLSKTVPIKSKFLNRTKVQVLWDMLAGRQMPKGQPVVFRVGYNFK
ncbi:MAG: hypothetical protein IPG86_18565 [Chitinophagaceae bacterium]|nr:hypothetical protein [Chitinophagaceae bacterium]